MWHRMPFCPGANVCDKSCLGSGMGPLFRNIERNRAREFECEHVAGAMGHFEEALIGVLARTVRLLAAACLGLFWAIVAGLVFVSRRSMRSSSASRKFSEYL